MEPLSNTKRSSADEPTREEMEAGACLPREPEPLASTAAEPSHFDSTPAVKALVDRHPARAARLPADPSRAAAAGQDGAHPGIALGIGMTAAMPGSLGAIEASVGIVVDLGKPKISVFGTDGSGKAIASGLSLGVSAQASFVADVRKFWGSGVELGINTPDLGVALNLSSPGPGEPLECNGMSLSVGPSIGVDAHYFETQTDGGGVSEIENALKRVTALPGFRRMGL